jgi:L-ascorbate oxidase
LANDTGTHLFHSHSGIQRADGLFGAIIVRDKNDLHSKLYDFDLPEHVIVFNDWISTGTAQEKLDAFKYDRKDIFEPEAILINGRGTFKGATTEQMAIPRNVFKVIRNKRFRFRLISAGVLACPLQISIQDHKFSVIASDGQDLEPENDVEALTIFAGFFKSINFKIKQPLNRF